MVIVWMPVYNEAKYLQKTIDSVLGQTFSDFRLVISDNYSTDGSSDIIDAAVARDARITKVRPPKHLSAIEHGRHFLASFLDQQDYLKYSIHIGGHDVWKANYLQTLWWRAEAEPDAAVVYTDAYDVDDCGGVNRKLQGYVFAHEVSRPFVPHYVLLGLTHNIMVFGLERESIRRRVKIRHLCCASDHLMLAEKALYGKIIYQPGSAIYVGKNLSRQGEDAGIIAYVQRHIPVDIISNSAPIVDFINQLEWVTYLVDKSVEGNQFYEQTPIKNMLKSSLIEAYICRYCFLLNGFAGGLEMFFGRQEIRSLMEASGMCVSYYESLINSLKK